MSSQRGNVKRTRPQKHQNKTSFKNDLHDTRKIIKQLNNMEHIGLCEKCKDVIAWKIKYKKYKPLTVPKKCVFCEKKNIKTAYHIVCMDCGKEKNICTKCQTKDETIQRQNSKSINSEITQLEAELKYLPERKRRTVLRVLKKENEGMP